LQWERPEAWGFIYVKRKEGKKIITLPHPQLTQPPPDDAKPEYEEPNLATHLKNRKRCALVSRGRV